MREFITKRTALIDADFIAYQLAAWAHSNQASTEEMSERIQDTFNDWMDRACCTDSIVCFSDDRENNFRRDHYPLYKIHRTSTPPALLPKAKRLVERAGGTVGRIPRLEADDVMGILATAGKVENPVIITEDKDLRQIPGWHLNPRKEDFPVRVGELEADYVFYTQWLTGDPTDGFGGIKGCGPAKARKILNTAPEGIRPDMEATADEEWAYLVLRAYDEAGMSYAEALAQARCARILRSDNFDRETRKEIPWVPPSSIVESLAYAGA